MDKNIPLLVIDITLLCVAIVIGLVSWNIIPTICIIAICLFLAFFLYDESDYNGSYD